MSSVGSRPPSSVAPLELRQLTASADGGVAAASLLEAIAGRTAGAGLRREEERVAAILEQVRERGDAALLELSERFDGVRPDPLRIPADRLEQAWRDTPAPLQQALRLAHDRILAFHQRQRPDDLTLQGPHGERLGRRWRPVRRAGLYVPGGRAAYPKIGRAHV